MRVPLPPGLLALLLGLALLPLVSCGGTRAGGGPEEPAGPPVVTAEHPVDSPREAAAPEAGTEAAPEPNSAEAGPPAPPGSPPPPIR